MAASKPTSSLSEKSHLLLDTLSVDLGTLIGDHRLFPLCLTELCPRRLTAVFLISGIRSLIGLTSFRPIQSFQCSTPRGNTRRYAKTYFGENQLLPGSISFSLLPTSHPMTLNDQWVRAFPLLSEGFTLLMGSSPGFGSYACDLSRYSHSVSLRLCATCASPCHMHKLVGSFFNRHARVVRKPP